MNWKSVIKAPMTNFSLVGLCLFLIAPAPESNVVTLDSAELATLTDSQARREGHSLTESQKTEIAARYLQDEIFYREAKRLGLDRDDHIVRQRLVQKLIFLAEALAGAAAPPGEEELQKYYEATKSRRTGEARFGFDQIYFMPQHRQRLEAAARKLVSSRARKNEEVETRLGDPSLYPLHISLTAESRLVSEFGEAFVEALKRLPFGKWSPALRSRYGYHLVRVRELEEPRLKTFEEARAEIAVEYVRERRGQAIGAYYQSLLKRYHLKVERKLIDSIQVLALASKTEGIDE